MTLGLQAVRIGRGISYQNHEIAGHTLPLEQAHGARLTAQRHWDLHCRLLKGPLCPIVPQCNSHQHFK